MSKVITFSTTFPAYHPKAGQATQFPQKVLKSLYPVDEFYMALCGGCGFHATSACWEGGNALADTGDFDDPYCPKCGSKNFEEIMNGFQLGCYINDVEPKGHTIRAGHRFKAGDKFSPRIWSGVPYRSKQLILAPDTLIVNTFDFVIINVSKDHAHFTLSCPARDLIINTAGFYLNDLAKNDGLSREDLLAWFKYPKGFKGQVICWDPKIDYFKL